MHQEISSTKKYIPCFTTAGISTLPLLLWLHREHRLCVDRFNQFGLTPLMITCKMGDAVMADVCNSEL